ncbi:MAG: hypothetical protein V1887_03860 [Candidatus Aenigmatarchaeota archaeon]
MDEKKGDGYYVGRVVRQFAERNGIEILSSGEPVTYDEWRRFQSFIDRDKGEDAEGNGIPCYLMRAICNEKKPSVTGFSVYQDRPNGPFFAYVSYGNTDYRLFEIDAKCENVKRMIEFCGVTRTYYPVTGYTQKELKKGLIVRKVEEGILGGRESVDFLVEPSVWDSMVRPFECMDSINKAQLLAKHCLRGSDDGRSRPPEVMRYLERTSRCLRNIGYVPADTGRSLLEKDIYMVQDIEPDLPIGWTRYFLRGLAPILDKLPEQPDPEMAAGRMAGLFNNAGAEPKWSAAELLELSCKRF